MATRTSIDDRLLKLRLLRDEQDHSRVLQSIRASLSDPSNLIVAEAARFVTQRELRGLEQDLIAAWNRLFQSDVPIKSDKGCVAKTAILEALGTLEVDDTELYLSAISYTQVEPAWPKAIETAEHLRAAAAYGLARSRQLRTVDKLITLVDYAQGTVFDRVHAVQAMADTGSEAAIPLVRMMLLSRDLHPDVAGACMSGLLGLAPGPSIPLIEKFLYVADPDVAVEAALALGGSGKPAAVSALIQALSKNAADDFQRTLLLSIGMSREPAAINFLISQLEDCADIEPVLEALKPARVFTETRLRIEEALRRRDRRS